MEYIDLLEPSRRCKQHFTKIDHDKRGSPSDYRIYYVNTDLRHQYGIFAAETQTFLRPKRPHASGEEPGETAVFAGYVGSCR